MAPLMETREQAEILVDACRYRPLGRRGLGLRHGARRLQPAVPRAPKMDAANDAILTIALIESARGIENADAILATPGLDLGWLGHYDLSDSLGCVEAFDDPRYVAAEKRLLAAVERGRQAPRLARRHRRSGAARAARAVIAASASATKLMVFRNALGAGVRRREERVTGPHPTLPGSTEHDPHITT